MSTPDLEAFKRAAALAAVDYVKDGMIVGLGTGSTSRHLVMALGEKVKGGLHVRGVCTSQETASLAARYGIALIDHEPRWTIDVAFDGADQVDPSFHLIKGGGGALLKEKIVASSAKRFVVLVDHTKLVPVLGGTFPLPVEVVPFGWGSTARHIEVLTQSRVEVRERGAAPFRTECGNLILDVHVARIERPDELEIALNRIPGVVETGLFVGRADVLIVGTPHGTETHNVART